MEVILKEDFPSLGYVGDRISVKPGYARNFLVPRGIAVEATSRTARVLQHELSAINAKKAKRKAEAEDFGRRLGAVTLDFTLKTGEQGKSFGSVTAKEIEAALKAEGFAIDRRQIRLLEPVKTAGEHKVPVKLHSEVSVPVMVKVQFERQQRKASAPAEARAEGEEGQEEKPKKGKGRKASAKKETESAEDSE